MIIEMGIYRKAANLKTIGVSPSRIAPAGR
jgi:hypothetical protein